MAGKLAERRETASRTRRGVRGRIGTGYFGDCAVVGGPFTGVHAVSDQRMADLASHFRMGYHSMSLSGGWTDEEAPIFVPSTIKVTGYLDVLYPIQSGKAP